MTDFIVGIPRLNETTLFKETIAALDRSTWRPVHTYVIDNGEVPLRPLGHGDISVIHPQSNRGCAGSWNLLHKLAAPLPIVLVNADCAVAPDTFERLFDTPTPALVCANGFSCFRMDEAIWTQVGEFDEGYWPVYWEDTDYRYRCKLLGVPIHEWDLEPRTKISEGREISARGITHGKAGDGGYNGWTGEKFTWFYERLHANQARYVAKWGCVGGEAGHETFTTPWGK